MYDSADWRTVAEILGTVLLLVWAKWKERRCIQKFELAAGSFEPATDDAGATKVELPGRNHDDQLRIASLEASLAEATNAFRHEHELINSLIEHSPDMIYFKDTASRFIRCSRFLATAFGALSAEDMIGKTDFDCYPAERAQSAFDDEQEIIRTGNPLVGKMEKTIWPDGRVSWVLTSKIPLRDENDEIYGTVGISKDITEFKLAETRLEALHKQLRETSRLAGMAEVATSVLHNVGNVLNSVNVSATVAADKLRTSKVSNISKLVTLLDKNRTDLADFLLNNPQGEKIVPYLKSLGEQLLAERAELIEELSYLQKNVEHIREIVAMQQSHATISGVLETIPIVDLVEDALHINSVAMGRHQVALQRVFTANPLVTTQRHKILQILVNLIENAKYSCSQSGRSDKQISVYIDEENGIVTLRVIDNGLGIPAENLTRIFSHGFTTKKEGHGFGLHSAALTAREMGGTLVAASDGLRKGAQFILKIPVNAVASGAGVKATSLPGKHDSTEG